MAGGPSLTNLTTSKIFTLLYTIGALGTRVRFAAHAASPPKSVCATLIRRDMEIHSPAEKLRRIIRDPAPELGNLLPADAFCLPRRPASIASPLAPEDGP
jgi:hypothetical protein